MKVKILKSTVASGKTLKVGTVCEVGKDITKADASLLYQLGHAEVVNESAKPLKPPKPPVGNGGSDDPDDPEKGKGGAGDPNPGGGKPEKNTGKGNK